MQPAPSTHFTPPNYQRSSHRPVPKWISHPVHVHVLPSLGVHACVCMQACVRYVGKKIDRSRLEPDLQLDSSSYLSVYLYAVCRPPTATPQFRISVQSRGVGFPSPPLNSIRIHFIFSLVCGEVYRSQYQKRRFSGLRNRVLVTLCREFRFEFKSKKSTNV
jgi:hypothetical protein